ncbi:MAG: hypothetical protein A4E54_02179 [Pelotomaculum sp. PtaB.Bin117]|nr:MAG: hypothetical protein A4E54_02179 [Pelotomaculum sp. PtaB.Bin117]OPY60982.1 MAG: hypothetical protein A4E56_02360 [Pelotomaculum sp. PtaU1.Bin065]
MPAEVEQYFFIFTDSLNRKIEQNVSEIIFLSYTAGIYHTF